MKVAREILCWLVSIAAAVALVSSIVVGLNWLWNNPDVFEKVLNVLKYVALGLVVVVLTVTIKFGWFDK